MACFKADRTPRRVACPLGALELVGVRPGACAGDSVLEPLLERGDVPGGAAGCCFPAAGLGFPGGGPGLGLSAELVLVVLPTRSRRAVAPSGAAGVDTA